MTGEQLQRYYDKLPRTTNYDSDGERVPTSTCNLVGQTNIPGLQLRLPLHPVSQPQFSPVHVAAEDEHARDLLEALNSVTPMPGSPRALDPLSATTHPSAEGWACTPPVVEFIACDSDRDLSITALANMFEFRYPAELNDPSRLVPDPFLPDHSQRITAVERDAIVQTEQEWRLKRYGA